MLAQLHGEAAREGGLVAGVPGAVYAHARLYHHHKLLTVGLAKFEQEGATGGAAANVAGSGGVVNVEQAHAQQ